CVAVPEIKTLAVRPTTPEAPSEPFVIDRGRPRKKAVLVLIGLVIVGSGIATRVGFSSTSRGKFTPATGWTIERVATLGLKIDADDGRSSATAACAAKAIATATPWSGWQALRADEESDHVRTAEGECK